MLLIVEEKPVQYRAPLYAEMDRKQQGALEVVYQSSGAVLQSSDKEFGSSFSWDIPLLTGYTHEVLDNSGVWLKQLGKKINSRNLKAILLTGFDNRISLAALILSLLFGKDLWIRMETQDVAFHRSPVKSFARSWIYKLIYAVFSRALFIGKLNLEHYLRHGFKPHQLHRVPYIVNDPISTLSLEEKQQRRKNIRNILKIPNDVTVVSFFGKLIPKKNPDLLLEAYSHLTDDQKDSVFYLFVGSGDLEASLKQRANELSCNATFTGFINQSRIHDYYLAADIMCLPSRQMGETWGLTVNEGLQAGCSILCSEYVGSSAEFGNWQRVRVCKSEDVSSFAIGLSELMKFKKDFDWCSSMMAKDYSMESAAIAFLSVINSTGIDSPLSKEPTV